MERTTIILVIGVFLIVAASIVVTDPSEAVSSLATVDVSNPASGYLKFSETMPNDATMVFEPLKVTQSSKGVLVQKEQVKGKANVTLVDTRKNYPKGTQHSLSASMSDKGFAEYGMLVAKMKLTIHPQTKDASILALKSVTLSGEEAELFSIDYREGGLKDKVIQLRPSLEVRESSFNQLAPGTVTIYGSQIRWTLTPKI